MSAAPLVDSTTSFLGLATALHEALFALQEARDRVLQAELRVTQVAAALSDKAAEDQAGRNREEAGIENAKSLTSPAGFTLAEPQFHEACGSDNKEKLTKKQNEFGIICRQEPEVNEDDQTSEARYYCVTEVPKQIGRHNLEGLKGIHWCSWDVLKVKFQGKNPNNFGGKVAGFDSWRPAVAEWHANGFYCEPFYFPQ
jgi:hypothetical protein